MTVEELPKLNAILNGTTFMLLLAGFSCIKAGKKEAHRWLMSIAFVTSTAFLVSYLIHKFVHGPTSFTGQGTIRFIYFAILVTHTILAIVNLPLILRTMYLAIKGRYEDHKQIAAWTFPIWMYVSVTGVVVYLMLYQGLGT